ncbi:MAG: hypothetical protein R3Y64_09545 [Peptostreptococcaceae bacterium]
MNTEMTIDSNEIFNNKGLKCIEYKKELLNKSNSIVVRESLMTTIDSLSSNGIISVSIYISLKDDDIDIDKFKIFLREDSSMIKDKADYVKEFQEVERTLKENHTDCELLIEDRKVGFMKEFVLTEEFIRDYFLVESDEAYNKLIKKHGFIEKFAVLRINKIFKDFFSNQVEYEYTLSDVFFDTDNLHYGIFVIISFNLEDKVNSLKLNLFFKDLEHYFNQRIYI